MAMNRFVARIALLSASLLPTSSALSQTGPARTEITLANFSFTPSDIHLHNGQKITLHFVNAGSGGHDFSAPEFFAAAQMDAAMRAKLGGKGKIALNKGQSTDIVLTPKTGTYKVKCSHFLHSSFGMNGAITVS